MSSKTKKEADKDAKNDYRAQMRMKATQMSQALTANANVYTQTNDYYNKIRQQLNDKKMTMIKSYRQQSMNQTKLDDDAENINNDEDTKKSKGSSTA